MMDNFKTILDVFIYAKEQKMCTTPFCTTCGAMDYRNMCRDIGPDRIKNLIESVTEEELEHMPYSIKYHGWYGPLRILLLDGFSADPNCPMMKWYNDGEEVHMTACTKKLIFEMPHHKVYGVIGSIFANTECEVTALFQYIGCAALTIDMKNYLEAYQIPPVHGALKESGFLPPNVKAVYYAQTSNSLMQVKEVEHIIDDALSLLSSKGYQSVAMNGVRTLGYSELDNLNIIERWFGKNPQSPIHTIHLVDKRGGFNKLR